MKCLTDMQLKSVISGDMQAEQRRECLKHIYECSECRQRVRGTAGFASATNNIAARVLMVEDCPEYEVLSMYLDEQLSESEADFIKAHVNSCELCHKDLQQMRAIRAQAALREPVVVNPGSFVRTRPADAAWKWVFAGFAGTAVVALVLASLPSLHKTPVQIGTGDVPPAPIVTHQEPVAEPDKVAQVPEVAAPAEEVAAEEPVAEAPAAVPAREKIVLADGNVKIVERDGKQELKIFGKGSSVEKLVASYIDQKLRTGKVKPAAPVVLAKADTALRSGSEGAVSLAPVLQSPVDKVIVSAQPLLEWKPVDLAHDYRVTVTDAYGRAVFDIYTSKNRTKIDIPLDRGEVYAWRVASRYSEESEWEISQAAVFKIISDKDLKLIEDTRKQFGDSKLAMGAVYESLQLQDEANREYKSLAPRARGIKMLRSLNGK